MFSLQTKGPEIHFLLIIYERANFEGKFLTKSNVRAAVLLEVFI